MIHYDKGGREIESATWSSLIEDDEYRVVEATALEGGDVRVSTVWTGIDYSFGAVEGKHLMFETHIFGGPYAGEGGRNYTIDEAREYHALTVAALKAGEDPDTYGDEE